jgi:hypothetical protein
MNGVASRRGVRFVSLVSGLFMPRRKLAIISRASSLRLFFIMVKFLLSFIELVKLRCSPGAG